jgi:hypothetical protein
MPSPTRGRWVVAASLLVATSWLLGACANGKGGESAGASTDPVVLEDAGGLPTASAEPDSASGTGNYSEGTSDPGSGSSGGSEGNGDSGGTGSVAPSPEDCVSFNPANLSVSSAGASGWYLRDGSHSLALLDTSADAQDALKVARNHTMFCFIGRSNHRADRYLYIVHYFAGVSNLPKGAAPVLDCTTYQPANVTVIAAGADGWRLVDGGHVLLTLDTAAEGERARLVASAHTQLCFIGRDNSRPDRERYIFEYWRG